MIRTHIGLPPLPASSPLSLSLSPPPPPPLPFHWCLGDALPKLRWCSPMHPEVSRIYHRPSQRTISNCRRTCSANIRLYRRCIGEHSPNHRKSIFFIGTAGIYAQNRKASGSIACIIIHFTIADAKIPNGAEALAACPAIEVIIMISNSFGHVSVMETPPMWSHDHTTNGSCDTSSISHYHVLSHLISHGANTQ